MRAGPLGRRSAVLAACAGLLALASNVPAYAATRDRTVVLTVAPERAAAVAKLLRRNGFRVTPNDAHTLAARGPATAALTHVDGVENVAGLGRQRAWRRHAVPAGHTAGSLRSAYDVARPGSDGAGLTVATVQFSGWDPDDLTTYATTAGLPQPDLVEIAVGAGNPRDTADGGDVEVALDQEVLLAAAPKAAQRVYFGANTTAEAVLVYSRIATDAEAGLVDVVSTSWGLCEPDLADDAATRASIETQLARIVAAGATVFAATGDMGAYDCSSPEAPDSRVAVDYPATSPNVVAVGGTRLAGATGSWTETAWNDPTASGTFQGYAGGGGESSTVPRPTWQAAVNVPGTGRLVPDVAAVAAPDTGFGMYAASVGWHVRGGTSASTPLVAGHLAAALSSAGRTSGVGDIHDELYSNPAAFRDVVSGSNLLHAATTGYDRASGLGSPRWAALAGVLFGDPVVIAPTVSRSLTIPLDVTPVPGMTVTSWTVGEGTSVACDPAAPATVPTSITLGAGNDRATHVAVGALADDGSCHVGIAPVLLDTHRPTGIGATRAYRYDTRTVVTWGATDPAPSSGIAAYDVCVWAMGSGCVWTRTATTARSATLTLSQGRTYVVRVTPVDRAGNRGSRVTTARYTVPLDSSALSRTPSWTRYRATSSWYGSHLYSSRVGATLKRSITGTRYEVLYVAHPRGGAFDVYVGGVRVKRVRTYASTKQYRKVVLVLSSTTRKSRAVKLVVVNGGIAIDAVRVAY
jgi:hypothetical protein